MIVDSSEAAPRVVVGIDPGETTGVCVLELGQGRTMSRRLASARKWLYEFPVDYSLGFVVGESRFAGDMMSRLMTLYEYPSMGLDKADVVHVAIEDFVLREHNTGRSLLSPVRITAALCALMHGSLDGNWLVSFNSAADAKNVITDSVLNKHGLYEAGMPHARDAARHAMLYLRKW